MAKIINNPAVPYLGPIEDGFNPGKMVRIQGHTTPHCDRFNVNLQCGGNVEPRDDIALHASVRVAEGYIARNTLINQQWGEEQGQGQLTIGAGQQFEILLLCEPTGIKIAVNGQHFCDFPHKVQFQRISHLAIDGDVDITLISHEFLPPPPQMAPQGSAPPMQHGAPMYGPPQGSQYGPGPQGQYGPPPPPGAGEDKSSGFDSFLGEAGVAIAGMIGQQAIQKLAGSNTTNQPAQQNPAQGNPLAGGYGGQSVGGLGSIGSILTNVLSEAATKNHGTYPFPQGHPQHGQAGGMDQSAGLIALGSILSNVLNESNKNQPAPNAPVPPTHQQGQQGSQDQGGFGGTLGSILGNVLSDAGQRHQQPPPPPPQQQPQGGADIGNLLGSLASSFFSPQQPRKA